MFGQYRVNIRKMYLAGTCLTSAEIFQFESGLFTSAGNNFLIFRCLPIYLPPNSYIVCLSFPSKIN